MSNTVKLVVAANKTVLAAHPVSAKIEAPEGATIVTKEVYGPTAYNRFIVDGRYVAKNVVEQIWVALANGEQAVKTRRKSTKAEKVEARAAQMTALGLTDGSLRLLRQLMDDAPNWGGGNHTVFGQNVGTEPADKGNLTDLKVKGYVTTQEDEGVVMVFFTESARALHALLAA